MRSLVEKKGKEIFLFVTFLLVLYLSEWFWRLSEESVVIMITVTLLGLLLSFDLLGFLKTKKKIIVYFILVIVGVNLVFTSFNSDLFKQNGTERSVFEQRKELNHGINKLFINNGYNSYLKVQRNFFTNLDFNQYFFGGEPRFRNYAVDFSKFPFLFLPFFIYGIYIIAIEIKKYKIFLFSTLLVLVLATFTQTNSMMGIYTLFPIVISLIVLGLYSFFSFTYKKLRSESA